MDATTPASGGSTPSADLPARQAETLLSFDDAPAASSGSMTDSLLNMAPLFAIAAIFYFVILRPQNQEQKRLQELLAGLKKGDLVVTSTGIHAVIHEVRGDELVLEIADRVRVVFDRSAVARMAENDQAKE